MRLCSRLLSALSWREKRKGRALGSGERSSKQRAECGDLVRRSRLGLQYGEIYAASLAKGVCHWGFSHRVKQGTRGTLSLTFPELEGTFRNAHCVVRAKRGHFSLALVSSFYRCGQSRDRFEVLAFSSLHVTNIQSMYSFMYRCVCKVVRDSTEGA